MVKRFPNMLNIVSHKFKTFSKVWMRLIQRKLHFSLGYLGWAHGSAWWLLGWRYGMALAKVGCVHPTWSLLLLQAVLLILTATWGSKREGGKAQKWRMPLPPQSTSQSKLQGQPHSGGGGIVFASWWHDRLQGPMVWSMDSGRGVIVDSFVTCCWCLSENPTALYVHIPCLLIHNHSLSLFLWMRRSKDTAFEHKNIQGIYRKMNIKSFLNKQTQADNWTH